MVAEKVKTKQVRNTKTTKNNPPRTPKTELIIKTAMEHPDLTTREIGAIADCSHVNVINTLQRYHIDHAHMSNYKTNRADILSGLQDRFLSSITETDLQKTPVGTRVLAACQLYDKERLERGQSTSNLASVHADIAALRALETGSVPTVGTTDNKQAPNNTTQDAQHEGISGLNLPTARAAEHEQVAQIQSQEATLVDKG